MTMRIQFVLVCGLLAGGCGGGDKDKASAEEPKPAATAAEAVSAGFDMLESVATAIEGAEDCEAKAASLKEWTAANQEQMTAVGEQLKAFPPETIKAEVDAGMEERPSVVQLFESASLCAESPAFVEAWEEASAAFGD